VHHETGRGGGETKAGVGIFRSYSAPTIQDLNFRRAAHYSFDLDEAGALEPLKSSVFSISAYAKLRDVFVAQFCNAWALAAFQKNESNSYMK